MALTAKQKHDMNNMNVAAQNALLGTVLEGFAPGGMGRHVVTAAQSSASAVQLEFAEIGAIRGWIIQGSRSGSTVAGDIKVVGASGSVLTLSNGATYKLTANDIITYLVI